MTIRRRKIVRRDTAGLWLSLLLISFVVSVAACGGGSSGGSGSSSSGLWVPNFNDPSVTAFSAKLYQRSGTPSASITNQNDVIIQPNQALFDKKGNLWITNCTDAIIGAGTVVKYTAAQVRKFGTDPSPDPQVILADSGSFNTFGCPYGEAFDSKGNLWVTNRFDVDLIEFTPSQLETGGTPFPNTTITSFDFSSPEGIQFDGAGTLWVADIFSGEIFGFKAQTLAAAEGSVVDLVPDIVNSSQSMFTPTDVVIDKSGNQWVADLFANSILEFSASDIASSGSPTPIVVLTATNVTTAGGTALSLDFPQGLTFDHGGNLWVSNALSDNSGSIAKFSKDQIAASGSPNPEVFLDSDPNGLNLDSPVILSFGPSVK